MKKIYLLPLFFLFLVSLNSCTDHNDEYEPVSPVVLDITQVPYPKLSDYRFFEGDLKNQEPSYKVIPYKPASELFSDYAHKKRFVWMPSGVMSTYDGDDNVLSLPVGAALIKTFYYDNVLPGNVTKIIETRLMIKVSEATPEDSGWKLYDYIWNDEQTEAFLDVAENGGSVPITFVENNVTKTANYKIPAQSQCVTCHKLIIDGNEVLMPIGIKPQNMNFDYNYGTSTRNQLQKWQAEGYLDNSLPDVIHSTVDWKDTSKSLELRARSYLDINCAHCHRDGAHCDYMPIRFNFSNTDMSTVGLCMVPSDSAGDNPFIISAGRSMDSELVFRMESQQASNMMPIMGRTLVHEEGVAVVKQWIDAMNGICH